MDEEEKTLKKEIGKLEAHLQERMSKRQFEAKKLCLKTLLKNVQKRTADVREMEGKQF